MINPKINIPCFLILLINLLLHPQILHPQSLSPTTTKKTIDIDGVQFENAIKNILNSSQNNFKTIISSGNVFINKLEYSKVTQTIPGSVKIGYIKNIEDYYSLPGGYYDEDYDSYTITALFYEGTDTLYAQELFNHLKVKLMAVKNKKITTQWSDTFSDKPFTGKSGRSISYRLISTTDNSYPSIELYYSYPGVSKIVTLTLDITKVVEYE